MAKHEPKAPNRLPKDFDQMKVNDIQITNPDRAEQEAAGIPVDVEYPKHVHKFAGHGLLHDYIEVGNAKEEAAARKQGYMSPQEANEVGRQIKAAEDAGDDVPSAPKARKAKAVSEPDEPKAPKVKKPRKVKKSAEPDAPVEN